MKWINDAKKVNKDEKNKLIKMLEMIPWAEECITLSITDNKYL